MIRNEIKRAWSEGRPVINGWLQAPDSIVAEIMAGQGFDALTVDMQHGIVDYQTSVLLLQAMRSSGVVPMARVPWLDPASIMKMLDAGAYGIICPMISNRRQAEELVSCMRYAPRGVRSLGPTRATLTAGPNYIAEANDELLCFAMIETREGFENVESIVSTPGLDAIYVGPADLTNDLYGDRFAVGVDRDEPEMIEAIRHILDACHKAGIHAGIHCLTPAYAARAVQWGFDLVTLSTDLRLLAAAAGSIVAEGRKLIAAQQEAD